MNTSATFPDLSEEQYKQEIAQMMAQIEASNLAAEHRRAEIEQLKAQSQTLLASLYASLEQREQR